MLSFIKHVLFSFPELRASKLLVLPLLCEIQIRNGSKSDWFCWKMEQLQSQVIEHFVWKTVISSNANALASVLVEATSHRNLFTFSEILYLPHLQQVLHSSRFSPHCLLLKVIVVDMWRELEKQDWLDFIILWCFFIDSRRSCSLWYIAFWMQRNWSWFMASTLNNNNINTNNYSCCCYYYKRSI